MLLKFECENFGSIKTKVQFSMEAVAGLPFTETLIQTKDYDDRKYLRVALIYGANGSGKTTIIRAIDVVRSIVLKEYDDKENILPQKYKPHKLCMNKPTSFALFFIPQSSKEQTVYYYAFSYDAEKIDTESLFYWNGNEFVKIFEREILQLSFGDEFTVHNSIDDLEKTTLLLSYLYNKKDKNNKNVFSDSPDNHQKIKEVYSFFSDDIWVLDDNLFYGNKDLSNVNLKTQDVLKVEGRKEDLVKFMKSYCQILDRIEFNENEDEEEKVLMVYKDSEDNEFKLDLDSEESSGVQRLFAYAAAIFYAIDNGKIFIYDELERAIHPLVIRYIIQKFNSNTKTNAQAIFTTHADQPMDQTFLRLDQFWLTELTTNNGRETKLFSIVDFTDLSSGDNIREKYMEGRFGAIPQKVLEEIHNNKIDDDGNKEENDMEEV